MQSFQGSGAACNSIPGRGRAVMGWESLELQRMVCTARLNAKPAPASAVLGVFGCAAWEGIQEHLHESSTMTSRMHSPALASLCFKAGPHYGATAPATPANTLLLGQGNSPQQGQTGTWAPSHPLQPGKDATCSLHIRGGRSCSGREAGRDGISLRCCLTLFHKQFVKV